MKLIKILKTFKPRFEIGKIYGFSNIEADYLVDNGFAEFTIETIATQLKPVTDDLTIDVIETSQIVKSIVRTKRKATK